MLKPGGRLAIFGVAGCVSGAAEVGVVEALLRDAGFENIHITVKPESREFIRDWFPGSGAEDYVSAATIEATRPRGAEA